MITDNQTKLRIQGRTITVTRLFDAPIELMWRTWTEPNLIKHWWGPDGFTNTITKMEVKPGGTWEFIMHGPGGKDYENKNIYKEVHPLEKIVFEDETGSGFQTTVILKEQDGQTLVQVTMLFGSEDQLKFSVENFKADEGLKQNMDKLAKYLIEINSK
ncbi:polyketide cyclase [Fulvivirga sp. M361]|uniref:SRPBCC domain-containing protein n=1 Tax=Fulvivirga sp. M361 TaxID=2594266 RepID=UPI00117B99C0|nr:SRPBCC domain-containing protein [Fulvivirga sp. M361]TRX59197.1 polyketide cyclase [Fulvivirga sp. M361]